MRTFFAARPEPNMNTSSTPLPKSPTVQTENFAEQVSFWSDMSSSSDEFETSDNEDLECTPATERTKRGAQPQLPRVPPRKWQRLDVSYRAQRKQKHEEKMRGLKKALAEIEKLLKSKKNSVCCWGKWFAGTAHSGNGMPSSVDDTIWAINTRGSCMCR